MSWQKIRLHLLKSLLSSRVVYVMAKIRLHLLKLLLSNRVVYVMAKNTTAFIKVIVVKQSCVCHGKKFSCIY